MDRQTTTTECAECGREREMEILTAERFEQLIKDLDCAASCARQALHLPKDLDTKIQFNRMRDAIIRARAELRPYLYVYEDAVKLLVR